MIDISVIMPLHNPDLSRIEKSIESCLRQNCNVEIIVVNDCSVVDFKESGRYPLTIVNLQTQRGVSGAINEGLSRAWGEYIITLADDTFEENALSALLDAARTSADPVNTFTYGNIQLPDKLVVNKQWQAHKPGDGLRTSAAILWHRSHYPDCKFWHPPGLDYYAEDYDFVLQLEARGVKGLHIPTTVMNHTPGDQSRGVQDDKTAIRSILKKRHEELNK